MDIGQTATHAALCMCSSLWSGHIWDLCVCVCLVLHTQPCYRPDLQAGRAAAASLGLGWGNHLGLFLAGHITWGGGFLGLLDLVAPWTRLISRATNQWDLENRAGMEIQEEPEEAKCTSLRIVCRGRLQSLWAHVITFVVFWKGASRDKTASNRNVRSYQMVGRLVCEYVHI